MPKLDVHARLARPHAIVRPDGKRIVATSYQAAWMQRNAEAWAQGHDPKDYAIELADDAERAQGDKSP